MWKSARTAHACFLIIVLELSRPPLNAVPCNKSGNTASCAPIITVLKYVRAVPERIVTFGRSVSAALLKHGRESSDVSISHANYFFRGWAKNIKRPLFLLGREVSNLFMKFLSIAFPRWTDHTLQVHPAPAVCL